MQMVYIFGPLFGGVLAGILGGMNEQSHLENANDYIHIDFRQTSFGK